MHYLLRDMPREVSSNNLPNEPQKHSRLWGVEDIRDVLKKLEASSLYVYIGMLLTESI